jgi:hypothetical protein
MVVITFAIYISRVAIFRSVCVSSIVIVSIVEVIVVISIGSMNVSKGVVMVCRWTGGIAFITSLRWASSHVEVGKEGEELRDAVRQ